MKGLLCVALALVLLSVVDAVGVDAIKKHRQSKRLQAHTRVLPCPTPEEIITASRHYVDDPNGKGLAFMEWAKFASQDVQAPELVNWMKEYRNWNALVEQQLVANGGQITGQMRLVLTPKAYQIWDDCFGSQPDSHTHVNFEGLEKQRLATLLARPAQGQRAALLPAEFEVLEPLTQKRSTHPISQIFDAIDEKVRNGESFLRNHVANWNALNKAGRIQPANKWNGCT